MADLPTQQVAERLLDPELRAATAIGLINYHASYLAHQGRFTFSAEDNPIENIWYSHVVNSSIELGPLRTAILNTLKDVETIYHSDRPLPLLLHQLRIRTIPPTSSDRQRASRPPF